MNLMIVQAFPISSVWYREIFLKPGFHAVCYIGTMPRMKQTESCFLGYFFVVKQFTEYSKCAQIFLTFYTNALKPYRSPHL